MALGTKNTNTMSEALRGILQDLAYVQTLPDADLDFISTIQQTILGKLRAPMDAYMQSQSAAPGGIVAPPSAVGGLAGMGAPPPSALGMSGSPPADGGGAMEMGGMGAGGMDAMVQQMMGAGAPPGPPPGVRPDTNMAPAADELRRLLSTRAGA